MAFNFGSGTGGTSGQSSGGLFGTAGSNTTGGTGGSLFGSGVGGSTGFAFGQTPASGSSDNKTGGIFGQSSNAQSSDNKPSGGLFASKPSTGGFFGQQTSAQSADNKPSFLSNVGSSASETPGTPNQSAAPKSLFGSTTPAPASGFNFGTTSTTPAGQPPAQTLFGASTGTSTSQPQSSTPAPMFGNPPSNTGSSQQTTAAPTFGGIFSGGSSSSGGIFGQKKDATPSTGGLSFGQKTDTSQQPSSGGLFAQKPADSATTQAQSTPIFGANPSSSQTTPGGMFSGSRPTETTPTPGIPFGAQTSAAPASGTATFSWGQSNKDNKPADAASKPETPKPFSFPTTQSTPATSNAQPAASQPASSTFFTPTTQSGGPVSGSSQASTATPSTSNIFAKPGAPASQAAGSTQTGSFQFPNLGGVGLGGKQPESTQSSSAAPAATPLFSGIGTTSTPASSAAGTSTAASTSGFFGLGATSAPKTSEPATATTTAPTGGVFDLGGERTPAPLNNAIPTTAATTGLGASTLGQPNLTASTAGPVPPHQSRLKNKTMDEILTRWASDLTRYTKEFKQHAETVAHWDQIIVDNSQKIDKLYVKTRTCEKQTMSVEMQLAAVENQQNELEAWLNKYENDVDEMLAKDGPAQNELGGPDQERERTYKLAERLGEQLDDMGRDLESMIEEVNAANANLGKGNNADEPITQIVKILNSHLSQLQAIDQGTSALQTKVAAAQNAAKGMSYMNGSLGGDKQAAADNFWQTYLHPR
ncbi:FG-nucleoporin nsp1 [Lithohypha guttulata]|nr:FG-nucleoporin nsp1 [Lithohypha guttulata]